jgi:antitoxin (DNA-binding transcriptional repressor) of toxin-antitoxin stability system
MLLYIQNDIMTEKTLRFSELIERVGRGERFVICRRGKPAVALVSPGEVRTRPQGKPIGLAAVAGALGDWDSLDDVVTEIYSSRRKARDREVPDLD